MLLNFSNSPTSGSFQSKDQGKTVHARRQAKKLQNY